MRLFKTLANELKQVDVKLESLNLETLKGSDVNAIKNALFQLLGSDNVERAVADCMARCLYRGVKITPATFEPEDARPDYFPVAWEVVKFNLAPFFKNLDLSSMTSPAPATSNPE